MDDVLEAPPSGHDDLQVLAACLSEGPDGITLAYRLLDRMAGRYRLERASLVVHPPSLGPQVFVQDRRAPGADVLRDFLTRPPGLYGRGRAGEPGPEVGAAMAGCCELALAAQVSGAVSDVAGGRPPIGRPAVELALARAASRSARHGWPVTALLVGLAAEATGLADREELAAGLASVARIGDEVGDAGEGRVLAVLGGAGPEVASVLVDRLATELAAAGFDAGALAVATVRMPDETVDPEEVWRLAAERLAARGASPIVTEWTGTVPSALELELRSLSGVVAVGAGGDGPDGTAELTVVALEKDEGLDAKVRRRVAERFGEGVVSVVTVGLDRPPEGPPLGGWRAHLDNGSDAPSAPAVASDGQARGDLRTAHRHDRTADPRPRVAFVAARFDPSTGASEVTVARGAAQATGRASAGPLAGGAQATLAALGVLGVEVPFYLLSVERARSVPGEPVVAVLAPRHPEPQANGSSRGRMPDRIGVASGSEEVEAASRATLAALNRFLALPSVLPAP